MDIGVVTLMEDFVRHIRQTIKFVSESNQHKQEKKRLTDVNRRYDLLATMFSHLSNRSTLH